MTATTDVAAIRARWARVPTAWFWTDLPDGVLRVAFVPLTPGGAVPFLPPDGFPGRAWWAQFPGDMEEYEGADLQLAEAIAAAPTDIAALMAQIDALDDAITELLALRAQRGEAERARATDTADVAAIRQRWAVLPYMYPGQLPGVALPWLPPEKMLVYGAPADIAALLARIDALTGAGGGGARATAAALREAVTAVAWQTPQERVLDDAITELLALRAQRDEAERARATAQDNPYPVEVWTELTAAEEAEILAAIRATSVRNATDRAYASWGRRVLAAAGAGAGAA